MKRLLLFSILLFGISSLAYSQAEKPQWVINPVHFEGKTSKLVTISDYDITKEATREKAFKYLEEGGRKLNKGYRIIREYWEYKGNWAYGYFLVQVSNDLVCSNWEYVELETQKYPFTGRVFVPGMAQIYKGSKVKGGLIIGGEALGVAGIVTCFSMKSSNERLILEDRKHAQIYADRADMWQNIGWGCVAFTAAVYIYNIIDGAVAPGQKHIQLGKKSYNYAVAPVVTTRGDLGLAMRLNF